MNEDRNHKSVILGEKSKCLLLRSVTFGVIGLSLFVLCAHLSPINHYYVSLLLIVASILLYLYVVYRIADRNWLDLRAVFSIVWMFTIGLASLRLLAYQEEWQFWTWILLGFAYALFPIGFYFGEALSQRLFAHKRAYTASPRKLIQRTPSSERLFWVSFLTTIIGLLAFIIAICIKGTLPFFSSDPRAYVNFYTKFHVISAAATGISPLCYYTIRTGNLPFLKKVILYICILYSTFVFPILIVSRGVFLTSAIPLMAAVFYLHKRRFLALLGCAVIIGSVYIFASGLRNLTDNQLVDIFEPAQVTLGEENNGSGKVYSDDYLAENSTFQLSPKLSFLYSYLTLSHDNFNEAVQNAKEMSYGVRQFRPFNVILRLRLPILEKTYLVRQHLNTYNLITDAYYDFRAPGIVGFVLMWSAIFGVMQTAYQRFENPFLLLVLGHAISPVALSFFAAWMSIFAQWMSWGTVLLLYIATNLHLNRHHSRRTT